MQTKLICSDIDGTLLNMDRQLSQKTIDVVKNNAHIPFILISSRMPQAMEHLQEELDISHLPLICYNGGLIIKGEEVLQSIEIQLEVIRSLIDFCSETNIHSSLYHKRDWYVASLDYWAKRESNNTKVIPTVQDVKTTLMQWGFEKNGAHKMMCMGEPAELDALVGFIEDNLKNEVIGYRSKPTYLEISPKSISKKTSLETLLQIQYPEIKLENVMAFGDNYNDIDMLSAVGVGVAVENAIEEVKDVVHHKTYCNVDDGVALFLEDHLVVH